MPLENKVIIRLNEITALMAGKDRLGPAEEDAARAVFTEILEGGGTYDVEEIESWLETEGSLKSKAARVRVANLAHYVQSRHEQSSSLRMVGDDCCS